MRQPGCMQLKARAGLPMGEVRPTGGPAAMEIGAVPRIGAADFVRPHNETAMRPLPEELEAMAWGEEDSGSGAEHTPRRGLEDESEPEDREAVGDAEGDGVGTQAGGRVNLVA